MTRMTNSEQLADQEVGGSAASHKGHATAWFGMTHDSLICWLSWSTVASASFRSLVVLLLVASACSNTPQPNTQAAPRKNRAAKPER